MQPGKVFLLSTFYGLPRIFRPWNRDLQKSPLSPQIIDIDDVHWSPTLYVYVPNEGLAIIFSEW